MSNYGIAIAFRRILRVGSGLPELTRYLFDNSRFDEKRVICESSGIAPAELDIVRR
jgi:hypothetical protein